VEGDKEGDAIFHTFAFLASAGITRRLRHRESGSPEAQFQPADDPSDPAVTEVVDVAMRAC
jgi:hypothetical protein